MRPGHNINAKYMNVHLNTMKYDEKCHFFIKFLVKHETMMLIDVYVVMNLRRWTWIPNQC